MRVALILLAAGASTRMRGRDKLMEDMGGVPLLETRVDMALRSNAEPIIVVLPPDRPDRQRVIENKDIVSVINKQADTGMASSIKTGLDAVPDDAIGAIMLPADMPNITEEHINQMIDAAREKPHTLLRACGSDGRAKAPNYLPMNSFPLFQNLLGDVGGREVLMNYTDGIDLIHLKGEDPTLDLDTPHDWDAFRAK